MKRDALNITAFFMIFSLITNVPADILSKDVVAIKEAFDKVGATSCSESMAGFLQFLAKGRSISSNRQWGTVEPSKSTISVDFLISGTKNDYSYFGSIVLAPVGTKCKGNYVYSYVAPSQNCKAYMEKEGFTGSDWTEDMTDTNGDGGNYYFLSVKKSPALNFIFNDVAGGCSVTKREVLNKDM